MAQPFTNDEGFYLYDAKVLLEGRMPAGDVLVKSPIVAGLFMVGVRLASVIWARFTFVREIPNDTGVRSNPLLLWRR